MKMASAQNVETSVANNSPSQDQSHPDDLFQSRYLTVCCPISGHFDVTILYFVIKTKQIRTICSEDLSTSPLSSVLFAAELRFV